LDKIEMKFIRGLFGRKSDEGDPAPLSMPWDQRPSILDFIRSQVAPKKPGASDGGHELPDEERIRQGSQVFWAAGALDGVATHHFGGGANDETIGKTLALVVAYSRQPTAINKAAVYRHIIAEHVVSIIDPVIKALVAESDINHQRLYELAYSFVTESPDREPVKFGIAILGMFREDANKELFLTLGRHDEFTLFCAVALSNLSDDEDELLWTLARGVTGWGRIHVVERLAETTNPAIKNWLLREGFRNGVLYEYLATTCARAGGLLSALSEDHVDRELLTAAGELIEAMIAGEPAEGIDDYEDARPVIESYLGHIESEAVSIQDLLRVNSIKVYLAQDDAQWAARYEADWSAEARTSLRSLCDSILSRREWPDKIRAKLESEDEAEFSDADRAAQALGIDTWDTHWRRLNHKPTESSRWFHVMALCDEDRIGPVLELAEAKIDLAAIATGAAHELGLGPKFPQHCCLDSELQELRRFPNRGARLIEAGLQSPVTRNRNMAVNALGAWPRKTWSRELEIALEQAEKANPTQMRRRECGKLLKGNHFRRDLVSRRAGGDRQH
jgi:hypothetical protein